MVKSTNFSPHKIFMLHFLIISHHHISLQCFSGQRKDAEKFCVRSFYSFSASTLLCTTVFSCGIFWKCQGGARGWQVSWTILYSKTLWFCFGSFFHLTSQHSLHLSNKWHPFISRKLGIWNLLCTSLSLGTEAQKSLPGVVVGDI